ncbi:MAG: hypothetical protein IH840_01465 [Candidatus Heimdallarchaeota archaeon]|nr:hypothetical protein [Candidatus Heimdallarchaeota archaeon]
MAVILANQEVFDTLHKKINDKNLLDDKEKMSEVFANIRDLFSDQKSAINRLNQLLIDLRSFTLGTIFETQSTNLAQAIYQGINLNRIRSRSERKIYLTGGEKLEVSTSHFIISQSVFLILRYFDTCYPEKSNDTISIDCSTYDQPDLGNYVEIHFTLENLEFYRESDDLDIVTHLVQSSQGSLTTNLYNNSLSIIIKMLQFK